MLIPYKFTYLVISVALMIPWVVFFIQKKRPRKEMLTISSLAAVISIATSYLFWTKDWWRPETITGTIVGIEDVILGFAVGGIVTVAYERVFEKRYTKYKGSTYYSGIVPYVAGTLALLALLFWATPLTSFYSVVIAILASSVCIFYKRRDLIKNGIFSAFFMTGLFLPYYYAIMIISPGWIERTYLFDTLSGIMITGIPLEELVFWFLFGLWWGPYYEFWKVRKEK
jgi:hypothetical protein